MTQSNCNTCEYKHIAVDDQKSYGHCYMFADEPYGICHHHSELPINDKGLCNLAIWMAQMDEDVPESIEPSFEAVRDWLRRFRKHNWSGTQPTAFEVSKFKQRIGIQ